MLERTGCFGACPAYTVTIAREGAVNFVGQSHTRVLGNNTAKRTAPRSPFYIAKSLRPSFVRLPDAYRAAVSDLPKYVVTVRSGALTKRVLDYAGTAAGPPQAVRDIEDEIDRIAGTERWVGRETGEAPLAPTRSPSLQAVEHRQTADWQLSVKRPSACCPRATRLSLRHVSPFASDFPMDHSRSCGDHPKRCP